MAIGKVLSKADKANPEIKRLQGIIEKQQQQIADMRSARFKLKLGRRKPVGRKTFMRVIVPDSHGNHIDHTAAAAFLKDLELLSVKQVVMLGDHIDCAGFLALHHVAGFVPDCDYTYEQDAAACNTFLDEIQSRTGNVETYYIEGNHETRIARQILKMTLRNRRDSEYLMSLYGPKAVLNLDKRKINWVDRGLCYHGLSKRGTIRLGKCLFMHGTRTGVNAAQATLNDMGANTVYGHTHRMASAAKETIDGSVAAWSVGCLSELHPLYGDTRISGWTHGYGLQIVEQDGTFLHLSIPIVEGRSLLSHLLKARL